MTDKATIRPKQASGARIETAMDLIHYGSDRFIPELFVPIKDEHFIKPRGGLWSSPVGSEYGWRHWCEDEDFRTDKLKLSFRFRFVGRVMTIDSVEDMEALCWVEPSPGWHVPLWEPLELFGVDAVHLTARGQEATRWSHPRSLHGWDCETVLVMNPKCIQ